MEYKAKIFRTNFFFLTNISTDAIIFLFQYNERREKEKFKALLR